MAAINPGVASLISWWKLDEASGNAIDSHSTNTLTETSGTIASASGKVNTARDFELGDSEYFEIADNASLSFADEDFALGCWFKPESLTILHYLMSKWDIDGNKREYSLAVEATGAPRFLCASNPATGVSITGSQLITAGNLGFFVGWHDKTANTLNVQLNNGTVYSVSHTTGCNNNTTPFRLGADGNVTASGFADGILDEAFIYRKLLTSDEREWLYNSGNGRTYSELLPSGVSAVYLSDYGVM